MKEPPSAATDHDRSLIVFRVHDRYYAAPVEDIVEVVRMVAVVEIPDAPEWLAGLIDLRGRSLPVVDLRTKLLLPPKPYGLDSVIVVVERDGFFAGLIVDQAVEALSVPSGSIESSDRPTDVPHAVVGFVTANGRSILVLDVARLLRPLDQLRLPDLVSLRA